MEDKYILKSVTDALTGKVLHKITVPVKWLPPPKTISWWRKIIQKSVIKLPVETHRTFEIWPCVVGNQYRIAGHASLLKALTDDHRDNIALICENQPIVVYIVASAIQNNHLEPDQELIEFIQNNFDKDDLYTALKASFSNLGMESFSSSISLLKGTAAILTPTELSPKEGSELIASHIEK
jgi:hypothetical protein